MMPDARESVLSGRARRLLAVMRASSRAEGYDFMEDGEWFRASLVEYIGQKTINELCAAGLIEPRTSDRYSQWYRLVIDNEDLSDFGDLWIAAT